MRTIDSRSRWLGVCLLALAASLTALSVLGPLVAGAIHWRIGPTILSQLYGLDTVSLAVVAPLAVVAAALSLRGRPLGALLGVGPAAYAATWCRSTSWGPTTHTWAATTSAGSRCCWSCSSSASSRRCWRGASCGYGSHPRRRGSSRSSG